MSRNVNVQDLLQELATTKALLANARTEKLVPRRLCPRLPQLYE